MTAMNFSTDPDAVVRVLDMRGFGITWAGPSPFDNGFCFGSETGQLLYTDLDGRPTGEPQLSSDSREAINGVALLTDCLAVTTRKEINLIWPFCDDPAAPNLAVLPGGALDVVATPTGHFVIPRGRAGIMFVKPIKDKDQPVIVFDTEKHGFGVCRLIALSDANGGNLIACALRRRGIGFASFQEHIAGSLLHTIEFPGLDIVDICSMGTPENPHAVVAAARNGSLVLFRDVKNDKTPLPFKFSSVNGVVYRVLSANGDIYLLTSKGLFCLFGLAARFLRDSPLGQFSMALFWLPIGAVDANLVNHRWLLAVGADEVFVADIQNMPKSPDKNGQLASFSAIKPSWIESKTPEMNEAAPRFAESRVEQTCLPT